MAAGKLVYNDSDCTGEIILKNYFKYTNILFFLFCFTLIPIVASCSDDSYGEVKQFLNLLMQSETATLSDYYNYCGRGAEEELSIYLEVCKKRGWTPPTENPSCIEYIKKRQSDDTKNVSLYLLWLKSKIPDYSNIEIVEVKRINTSFKHELIKVNLDKNSVVFFKTVEPQNKREFGVLNITEINGISINEMFLDDLQNGHIKQQIETGYLSFILTE